MEVDGAMKGLEKTCLRYIIGVKTIQKEDVFEISGTSTRYIIGVRKVNKEDRLKYPGHQHAWE